MGVGTGGGDGRKTIAVLMGGISPEHPVSLVSGTGMLRALDPARYAAFPIIIGKDNRWLWPRDRAGFRSDGFDAARAEALLASSPAELADWLRADFPDFAPFPRADLFLLGLHGVGGEDGRLQGFLELAGQPYSGSRSRGCCLAMDKILSKQAYERAGIPTSPYRVLTRPEYGEAAWSAVEREFGFPVAVKDPLGGSSLGMGIAKDGAGLRSLAAELGRSSDRLLVERFVRGREGTCGHLEGFGPLPPTEIRPVRDGFFNFEAKYQPGRSEEVTPAPFPPEVTARAQELAERAHRALGLSIYSRTDFILAEDGSGLVVLETNNLPGFTPTSLLPQQAACRGLGYADLVSRIVEESLARWRT